GVRRAIDHSLITSHRWRPRVPSRRNCFAFTRSLVRRPPLAGSTTPYTVRRLVSRSAEETLVQSKLLSLVGCRPWRRIAETLEEWSEASEVGVPRDQRDASLAARRSDE